MVDLSKRSVAPLADRCAGRWKGLRCRLTLGHKGNCETYRGVYFHPAGKRYVPPARDVRAARLLQFVVGWTFSPQGRVFVRRAIMHALYADATGSCDLKDRSGKPS